LSTGFGKLDLGIERAHHVFSRAIAVTIFAALILLIVSGKIRMDDFLKLAKFPT
jgi:hypothetical protein